MQMQKMNSKITKTKTKTYSIWLTIHNSHNKFFLLPLELSVQFSCVQLQNLCIADAYNKNYHGCTDM